MILVDFEIEKAIFEGEIIINPLNTGLINPASLDIRLGNKYGFLRSKWNLETNCISETIDPQNPETFETEYHTYDEYILNPNQFCIVSMLEDITLPSTICAELKGKSSLGRLGLLNSAHAAGWIDSAWSGVLTMELSNIGPCPIKLVKGMRIGQLIFYRTQSPRYGYDKIGRYQRQEAGQGSKGV